MANDHDKAAQRERFLLDMSSLVAVGRPLRLMLVEFDRPASGVIDVGVYPSGVHEFVILGGNPGSAVRAVWIEGRRFTPQEVARFVALSVKTKMDDCRARPLSFGASPELHGH